MASAEQFPGSQVVFEPGTVQFLREPVPVPTAALTTDDGHARADAAAISLRRTTAARRR